MCGRYATTKSAADLSAFFDADDETELVAISYNVAPTDPVPVIRIARERDSRILDTARWGLVPHWATDTSRAARMINARAETVATSPAFAPSFARRRCLIPAAGWYEWVGKGAGKQAYYMTSADGSTLAFAGLYAKWGPRAAPGDDAPKPLLTCSVLTMPALGGLARVHDRMPLLLSPERWPQWLAGDGDPAALLAPPAAATIDAVEIRAVRPAVGNVRNNGPELIAPLEAALPDEPVELTLFG
jgi:putative SOS response-associated peptidase YedK